MAEAAGPVDRNPALFAGLRRARLEGEPAQRRSRHPEGAVERTYDQPSRSLQAPGHASTAHFRDHNRASLLTHDAHRRGGGSPGLENGTRPNPRPRFSRKTARWWRRAMDTEYACGHRGEPIAIPPGIGPVTTESRLPRLRSNGTVRSRRSGARCRRHAHQYHSERDCRGLATTFAWSRRLSNESARACAGIGPCVASVADGRAGEPAFRRQTTSQRGGVCRWDSRRHEPIHRLPSSRRRDSCSTG
jgi:hypothetical protein